MTGQDREQYNWELDASLYSPRVYIAIILDTFVVDGSEADVDTERGVGLILERSTSLHGKETYSRVGYLEIYISDPDTSWSAGGLTQWLEGWEQKQIRMI